MELSNRVGIVTGASRGIGVVIAEHLARKGVDLVLAARSKDDLEQTAELVRKHGRRVLPVATDVSDVAQLQALVDAANTEFGHVDLLVNNAGIEIPGHSEGLDLDHIATGVHINLTALIQLTRLVIPQMIERKSGHVCNIASVAGKVARPFATVYSATKHGVVGFSWSLRAELAPLGVEVTVVCPGYVSDVGMFADRTSELGVEMPPRSLKAVSAQLVAQEAIESIERNRAETIVGPLLLKIADVAHAISPDFAMGVARRSGTYDYVRREATGERA
ncbi:MAG: SDR family NAD(P)-dependent oxidoreductase [Actinomycetota bacterium]|nr:SDR family NAD(P)-dependent oxidoreductase [Actinomycetota bacterium]